MSDTNDTFNTIKADAHDTIDEAKNRLQSTGERAKRDIAGDSMPLGDKIISGVKEAGHTLAADIDKAKRDVRHDDAEKI